VSQSRDWHALFTKKHIQNQLMFKNYNTIALRNLTRNRVFSFINIAGLSLGLACCLLILLYAKDELSFDRFQKHGADLYRLTCHIINKQRDRDERYGISGMTQGPAFQRSIPEVKAFVRTNESDFILRLGTETFSQKATWVDSNFFSVFSFPLLSGSPSSVLADPQSVVLTEDMAKKYFGTTNALGKTLELEFENKFVTFTVSGIAKRSPANSSIGFDILLPFAYLEKHEPQDGWLFLSYSTFFLLQPGANPQAVSNKMQQVYLAESADQRARASLHGFSSTFIWGLQPFSDMHLDTTFEDAGVKSVSNPIYSYILTGIALFILGIACINFINLTIAQSLKRSKEIGLRKVVGSSQAQLVRQFLGESFVLCAIAFLLAIAIAWTSLPLFNDMANKRLSLSYLFDAPLIASFVGLFLLTGFVAGFYPALVLSRFKPVDTLYQRTSRLMGKNYLAKGLVVVQFGLATFLIITTIFFYSQYNFLTHTSPGYDDNNLLVVNLTNAGDSTKLMNIFRTEFARIPGVLRTGMTMDGRWMTGAKAEGKDINIEYDHIDEDYLPTIGATIVAGRNLSRDFPSDSSRSVLVNEAFVKEAGWKVAVGKTVDFVNGGDTKLTIVGVVKDYHYGSMKEKLGPQLLTNNMQMSWGRFVLRLDPATTARTLKAVEDTYRRLFPWHPFDHYFVREKNNEDYDQEARWRQIITCSAILTIFISCIGLFGLALLSIRQRTKEIGVRKVLGAGVWQVTGLVSKSFVGLVFLAFLVAMPVAWYVVGRWLDNFPYRVSINAWVFVAAGLLTLFVAAFTVGIQAIRAARANPVSSLRAD
jgi:putative ABC transport system permease protein